MQLATESPIVLSLTQSQGQSDVEADPAEYASHSINLQDVLAELKELWEVPWSFLAPAVPESLVVIPTITKDGDVILQLGEWIKNGPAVSTPPR